MKPKKNLARIMYGDPVAFDNEGNPFAFKPVLYSKRSKLHSRAFAVIPTATAQQARKLAAFFNMTPEQQYEVVSKAYYDQHLTDCSRIIAVLAAIDGGRT